MASSFKQSLSECEFVLWNCSAEHLYVSDKPTTCYRLPNKQFCGTYLDCKAFVHCAQTGVSFTLQAAHIGSNFLRAINDWIHLCQAASYHFSHSPFV